MSKPSKRDVVVIGGGLAGCAAAVGLAERGVRVRLVEREAYLGGRAGAWTDQLADGTPFEMERGFHAFFRNYANVRALIRRVDPELACLRPLGDYPLLGPDGASESFAGLPKTAPLNVLALIQRSRSIRFRDLLKVDHDAARKLLAFHPTRTYAELDDTTAKAFLDSLRFPQHARQMLFDVFAHSFFNPEENYSAAELLAMFQFYFIGNREGLVFDVMREPFSVSLFGPLERYLRGLGAELHLGRSVERVVSRDGGGYRVELANDASGTRSLDADAIVLAVDVRGLKRLVASSPALAMLGPGVTELDNTLPFAVWRLWLDRACAASRAPFAGTTGAGILDNISLFERFEGESARWADRTGGGVVELHAYALEHTDEDRIRRDLLAGLHALYPETKRARVLEDRFMIRDDCPAFAPGSHARRPTVETSLPEVTLAGDFVKLPYPSALMERATASGFTAANALLRRFGLVEQRVQPSAALGVFASA
ncbi:MAG: FAD-dependent oxidoreductase [Polyangiaceae bacterium]